MAKERKKATRRRREPAEPIDGFSEMSPKEKIAKMREIASKVRSDPECRKSRKIMQAIRGLEKCADRYEAADRECDEAAFAHVMAQANLIAAGKARDMATEAFRANIARIAEHNKAVVESHGLRAPSPVAPATLRAARVDDGRTRLGWPPAAHAQLYLVEHRTAGFLPQEWRLIDIVKRTRVVATHIGPMGRHWFRVIAVTPFGMSPPGKPVARRSR